MRATAGHVHGTVTGAHRGPLAAVLAITLTLAAVEALGGVLSGSLALLADAGHLLADAVGVALSLLAAWFAARPPTARRTFGWQRAEVLAATTNAVLLLVVGGAVLLGAVRRLSAPPDVHAAAMAGVAAVGLVGNAVSMLLLRRGQAGSLNVRGAFLEVLSDALGSGTALAAAAVIALTGFRQADAVAALAVGLLILPRAWRLLGDAVHILLENAPAGVDLEHVRRHLLQTPGVLDVHDLHAWTITSGMPVLTAHVVVERADYTDCGTVLDRLSDCLSGHFDVAHSTLQLEPVGHAGHEPTGPC